MSVTCMCSDTAVVRLLAWVLLHDARTASAAHAVMHSLESNWLNMLFCKRRCSMCLVTLETYCAATGPSRTGNLVEQKEQGFRKLSV